MTVVFNHFGEVADVLAVGIFNANVEIADAAVEHIKDHIISNGQIITGKMLDSVHREVQSDASQNVVVDCKNEQGEYYAAYPNYGTRYQPANPFFEPGLEDTQEDIDRVLETLVQVIEKVAAG